MLKTKLMDFNAVKRALNPMDMLIPLGIIAAITYLFRQNAMETVFVVVNVILMMGLAQAVGARLTPFNVVLFFLLIGPLTPPTPIRSGTIYGVLESLIGSGTLAAVPIFVLGALVFAIMVKAFFREVSVVDAVLLGAIQEAIFFIYALMLNNGIRIALTVLPAV